jgi:hypothetical protein
VCRWGRKVECIGVMNDKLEEIEVFHTLAGAGEGHVQGRGK